MTNSEKTNANNPENSAPVKCRMCGDHEIYQKEDQLCYACYYRIVEAGGY